MAVFGSGSFPTTIVALSILVRYIPIARMMEMEAVVPDLLRDPFLLCFLFFMVRGGRRA